MHADERLPTTPQEWEALWAPYDESTYSLALNALQPEDVVLEIGAGDLRLARRMAGRVRRVFAVERNPQLLQTDDPIPSNLDIICADAREWTFPKSVTAAVLLMRHCTCFGLYFARLKAAGVSRLITNARWGIGVEVIDVQAPRGLYSAAPAGWYACDCGAAGFKPGDPERFTAEDASHCSEVSCCPACAGSR